MFDDFFKDLVDWGFDRENTMERFIDDEQLYIDCLLDFIGNTGIEKLEEEIKAKNYEKVFDVGHTIKGVCGNLGLNSIFDLVSELVNLVRKPPYESGIDEQLMEKLSQINEQIIELKSIINNNNIG